MSMEDNYFKALDKYMGDMSSVDQEYYDKPSLHCSCLSLGCYRKALHQYYGHNRKPDSLPKKLIFYTGNMFHQLMQDFITQSNHFEIIGNEMDLTEGLPPNVSGKLDTFGTHKKTGLNILFEYKTARTNQFTTYVNTLPKDSHLIQAGMYKYALENMKYRVDMVVLIYLDKAGEHWPKWFQIESTTLDNRIVERIFTKANEYMEIYKRDKVFPPKIGMQVKVDDTGKVRAKSHWLCSYCEFKGYSCEGYPEVFDTEKVVGVLEGDKFKVNKKYERFRDLLEPFVVKQFNVANYLLR